MTSRLVIIAAAFAQLMLIQQPAPAAPKCPPPSITPIDGATVPGPPPSGLVLAIFNHHYQAWSDRLVLPDIAARSDTDAWTGVPEFAELIRPGKIFIPFILERLRAGDFRLVVALECITGITSVRLYPTSMPPPGTFGLQDVAKLWSANGGQVVEMECRARCSGDAACEQKCSDDRQQYWPP